uniref:Uncharacterized protein n=1 Tax=Phasianus colchicus TaxID=9054 RepID=A0A669QVJ0_PHACC
MCLSCLFSFSIQKSLKGFICAKLYFEIKEYELAKRYISTYLSVQERDPRAHRFLGQIYEAQDETEKAVGCYKRSLELNPIQKDLVLKIAELFCNKDTSDGRAKYWVEKAARLLPGNAAALRLKEKLQEYKVEDGWNELFYVSQAELHARPDDVYLNIRLVALYRSRNKLQDAVLHVQEAEKKIPLETSLEWCSCVVKTLEEYLESAQNLESNTRNWRAIKSGHLLAHSSFIKMKFASGDVRQCREALESFDRLLHSVKQYVREAEELSHTVLEMKGQLYMHAGTFLLKLAQNSEVQWSDACQLAALCYLKSFNVPKPKSKLTKGDPAGLDKLEMLACDRKSQSAYEEEARIAFAVLDAVEGKTDDAFLAFEAIKNVISYWNLAELCQRKAEEIVNGDVLPEEQGEHKTYLLKRKHYLTKIIDEFSSDLSVADKLPVSIETLTEMLNAVIQELGEFEEKEEGDLSSRKISQAAGSGVKHSIPFPKKLLFSPTDSYKFSPKTLPQWAEDAQSLLQILCQQVEALKVNNFVTIFNEEQLIFLLR